MNIVLEAVMKAKVLFSNKKTTAAKLQTFYRTEVNGWKTTEYENEI